MIPIRPRRSVLYMPGSNARAMEKARTLPADAIILDLEDAVAPDVKDTARTQVCTAVRDGGYGIGEPVLDSASLLWFDDVDALKKALASPENEAAAADVKSFVDPRYVHTLVTREHWIIGPTPRP